MFTGSRRKQWLQCGLFVLALAAGVAAVIIIDGRRFDAQDEMILRHIEIHRQALMRTWAYPGERW